MVSLFDVSVLSFIYRRVFPLHVSSVRSLYILICAKIMQAERNQIYLKLPRHRLSYAKIMIYVKKNKQYASFLLNVCSY